MRAQMCGGDATNPGRACGEGQRFFKGCEKLKPHAVDVKAFVTRDSIAFVSQRAVPTTYAWTKVEHIVVL